MEVVVVIWEDSQIEVVYPTMPEGNYAIGVTVPGSGCAITDKLVEFFGFYESQLETYLENISKKIIM